MTPEDKNEAVRRFAEHVRLNPDLVRASESDLRELAFNGGEAAAEKELERRRCREARGNPDERLYGVNLTAREIVELIELISPLEDENWTQGAYRRLSGVLHNIQAENRVLQ